MQCDAMRCDAMRCDAMRCDAMQCNVCKCKVVGSGTDRLINQQTGSVKAGRRHITNLELSHLYIISYNFTILPIYNIVNS